LAWVLANPGFSTATKQEEQSPIREHDGDGSVTPSPCVVATGRDALDRLVVRHELADPGECSPPDEELCGAVHQVHCRRHVRPPTGAVPVGVPEPAGRVAGPACRPRTRPT